MGIVGNCRKEMLDSTQGRINRNGSTAFYRTIRVVVQETDCKRSIELQTNCQGITGKLRSYADRILSISAVTILRNIAAGGGLIPGILMDIL